jgi:membrane fusion protein, heavy metal efflux system
VTAASAPPGTKFPVAGDAVERGGALLRLGAAAPEEGDSAALDLDSQRAAIEVRAAQRELDRVLPLLEQGVVSQRRVDQARSALETAQAELRSARRRRANLGATQRIGTGRDSLVIPAPIAGTIAEVYGAPGGWVQKDQPIARVVSRDRLWLDLAVPEAYIGRVKSISGAWFRLDAYEGVFDLPKTALVSIGTELDPKTRTLPVRFLVDNARGELYAGMTTRAHLITQDPQVATAIPIAAIVDDGGTDVIYVQTGGETFERRPVKLGVRDGLHVEAITGIKPGEWLAVTGAYSVKLASTSTESVGHGHAH